MVNLLIDVHYQRKNPQLARIVGNNEIRGMRRELTKELWEPLRHAMVMTPKKKLIVFPLNPESRQA